jgi:hypothetical protein
VLVAPRPELSEAIAVYVVVKGKPEAAKVASPYREAVVALTVTLLAAEVVVPMTVKLPPVVTPVNSLLELTKN